MSNEHLVLHNKDLIESLTKDGGLKTIQRIVEGMISPGGLCNTLKIEFKKVTPGEMLMECEYDPDLHSNPFGIANGGWHGAMLDNAAGYAGLSTVPAGHGAFTREMSKIRFYKPVIKGLFQAKGKVLSQEGNKIMCYGEIVDQDGVCYADADLIVSVKPVEEIRQNFEALGIQLT